MRTISRLAAICLIAAAGVSANRIQAAQDKEDKSSDANASMKANFDSVDTWIEGTVKSVDAEKGVVSISGCKLPFATAHAKMRKEFEQKAAGLSAEKRQELAEKINREWRGKLLAAQGEKSASAETFNIKLPSNGEMVMLERKSVQDVTFAYQPDEGPKSKDSEPNIAGELVSIDIYDIPAKSAATPASASSALSNLKVGDMVKVGIDSSKNEVMLAIVLSSKPSESAR
jgi:hypothetical protein